MSLQREMRKVRRAIEARGYSTEVGRSSGHLKVYDGGRLVASTGTSPGDCRSIANFLAAIRRYERGKRMPELAIRTFKVRQSHTRYPCPICTEPMKFQEQISITNRGRWVHTACLIDLNRRNQ